MATFKQGVQQACHDAGCAGWSNNPWPGYVTVYHEIACELSMAIRINFTVSVNWNNVQVMSCSALKCNNPLARPPERWPVRLTSFR